MLNRCSAVQVKNRACFERVEGATEALPRTSYFAVPFGSTI